MDAFTTIERVFYINLEHRRDRKQHIEQELRRLNVSSRKMIAIKGVHDILNGHRGCLWSHIDALLQAKKLKCSTALILEDDCIFESSAEKIHELLCHFMDHVQEDGWDVFLLGGKIKKKMQSSLPKIFRIQKSFLSHAYVVHGNYIDSLLRCFYQALQLMEKCWFSEEALVYALDHQWSDYQAKDRWFAGEMIAHQVDSFSDIDGIRREKKNY